jgi:cellulose synthase/poly-beta-1,6-N-acetylglucosamine synthase-like glycosyltransferase
VVVTRPQAGVLGFLSLLTLIFLVTEPHLALIGLTALMTTAYLAVGTYKVLLLVRGDSRTDDPETAPLADEELPIYTVLVPLHREGRILSTLVQRLELLSYPIDRLEIMLLVEADDEETQRAAARCPLPAHIRVIILPPGLPRTKPRALNIGLCRARGEFLVIYDAEDRPEADQIRKAVTKFRASAEDVVCLQARLNFYNWRQSILARLFTIEYSVLFDQYLPGLTPSRLSRTTGFIPLGGTSNHFRVSMLRRIGGWDPFNVTEDCDLGVRLAREGLRVGLIDSVTWEEAVTRVKPWIKQRSRWVKGYVQTYLVHMRHPLRLCSQLGPRAFVDFQMFVGANSLVMLLNPLMWALTVTYAATKGTAFGDFIEAMFPAPIYYPALLSFVAGNFLLLYGNAYVCVRHELTAMTRYSLLAPFYWILMSIGAWAGLISLIRNPFYWAKTEHGVSLAQNEAAAPIGRKRATQESHQSAEPV